jgi:hypothetical protein
MKLFAFNDERIAYLATHDYDRDLKVFFVHFIEDAEIAKPEFVADKRVGLERLDGPGGTGRLVEEASGDPVSDDPLFPGR